ncbi:MAG: type I methionyl aminopeptidase [Treponema sp.]|jgi:methionyl aminopeptidase|nr:type I methionyl aminopeptidase [Treponema sp.]
MIRLKNEKQIEGIRKSCKMLSAMYRELIPLVKPGIQTIEIDMWVRDWIKKAGGRPVFLGYTIKKKPYPAAICISVNEEVIHGIPSKRRIHDGDLVSLDCGIELDGFISDQAVSIEAGNAGETVHELNKVTLECLYRGITAVKAGDRLLQVSRAVESHAKSFGYGIVYDFCGHGTGIQLHEDPQVPNYPHGPNPKMSNGMVLAIEPMINAGTGDVRVLDDEWTVITADGKVSAHWEHTIAVFNGNTEILTDPLESYIFV